jgi:8-oxo-dGTP diphosphatase
MRQLLVVAAALRRGDGTVLLAQRPAGKALAGLWEFPGGKPEAGETPEAALSRELQEELGIIADDFTPFRFVSHDYGDFHLLMLLYLCDQWQGQPEGRDGQALRWETPAAMAALPMPPADVPLVAALAAAMA